MKHPNQQWNDIALQWREEKNHHIILLSDPSYPELLKEIASAPPILYVNGELETLAQPQIALVGSRNPSHIGLELAAEFAYALSQAGFIVTSGLALGIDTACHQGALNACAKTIAVLGSGLLHVYPVRNKALAKNITANGCVISELALNATPAPENFPRRNRVISGLSLGTVVIEAALKSGSLITARFALEQNRDVFAVPGSLRNPQSQGCLSLIQQGAQCVTSVNDILNEINIFSTNKNLSAPLKSIHAPIHKLDKTEQLVLACIEYDEATIDQICNRSKLSAQLVSATLLQLELKDVIKNAFGKYFISAQNHA
ncbi:MAG: DNA protecting protein DprA [Gammaproteobacteria bacterium RIFCSPHIGHO2_12_FULL_38_11]|nr:MAG: DNA protecting protein DprA [Gammaproteobacteria bacterium RIFCSPHIGHO2_12_FULL_38_11]